MGLISNLSNARFSGLRTAGFAKAIVGEDDHAIVLNGFEGEKFDAVEKSFDHFVGLFQDACSGKQGHWLLKEAHQVFEKDVLPALQQAGVNVVDAGNYSDASLGVYLVDAPIPAGAVRLKVPLRQGWRRFCNNSIYDAHARLEEVLHLLQFLNEAPLTKTGVMIEKAFNERDSQLLLRLKKNWDRPERRRLLVRENDIMGVYEELGLELPGIFLFPYDRRGVLAFIRTQRQILAMGRTSDVEKDG